jgi:hypothetical protein
MFFSKQSGFSATRHRLTALASDLVSDPLPLLLAAVGLAKPQRTAKHNLGPGATGKRQYTRQARSIDVECALQVPWRRGCPTERPKCLSLKPG